MKRSLFVIVAVGVLAVGVVWIVARAETEPAGGQGGGSQPEQQQYQQTIQQYAAILAANPRDQEAALRLGQTYDQAGSLPEALQAYDTAVQIDPWGDWADQALSLKAQASARAGDAAEAHRCTEQLRERFPDSTEAVRAAVLEAELAGQPTAQAAALLATETEAAAVYDQGAQAAAARNDTLAIQYFDQTIAGYPGTPAWLRAHNKKGHVLIRSQRREDAFASFTAILDQVGQSAPHSRIALTAQTRLAALYHAAGQREQAVATYRDLVDKAAGSPFAANAGLQVAGLEFEFLHRAVAKQLPIAGDQWAELRASCSRVIAMPEAVPSERVRAHLMMVETFSWQEQPEQTAAEADRFLQTYSGDAFKQEIATARFFAGEELLKLGRYPEALEHFRWVVTAYQGQREIWPRMDHLPRTYYRIWEALERSKAPEAEIRAAANALVSNFPESSYATVVAGIMPQEGN